MPHRDEPATYHLRAAGRVQGVAFRESMRAEALRLGVHGWVRNCRDGTVEAVVQGPCAAVETIVAWARQGPPAARVTQLTVQAPPAEYARTYAGFERLPTA